MNITCHPISVVPVRENYINVVKPKTANDSWIPSKMLDDFICSDGKLGVVRCHHILFPQKPSVVGTWSETSEKSGADYEICTAQCSPIIRPLEISEHEEKNEYDKSHNSSPDLPEAYASSVSNISIPASIAVLTISYASIRRVKYRLMELFSDLTGSLPSFQSYWRKVNPKLTHLQLPSKNTDSYWDTNPTYPSRRNGIFLASSSRCTGHGWRMAMVVSEIWVVKMAKL